jgi:hypothetical protein
MKMADSRTCPQSSAGVLSRISIPIDRAQRSLLLAGLFVAFALPGSWFAARRLRLG